MMTSLCDISVALFLLGWSCGLTGHFRVKSASFGEALAGHVVGFLKAVIKE